MRSWSATEGGPKKSAQRDTHKGVGCIWPVVHILLQLSAFPGRTTASTHESDGIDLQQDRYSTAIVLGLWIKHMRLAKRKLEVVHTGRILVEQVSKIRRWLMSRADR